MKTFPFKKIDAFVRGASSGNPAGCVYLDSAREIAVSEMQRIARELKGFVNEVGFLRPRQDGYGLTFYSSECEVAFCGHATIAIMYDLVRNDPALRRQQEVNIFVKAGKLTVTNQIDQEDAVYIMAPVPQYLPCDLPASAIAKALALDEQSIDAKQPIQVINAGLRTLIVPLVSLAACLGLFPPQEELRLLCEQSDIDIILVFTAETSSPDNHYRTRVFAPKYGYLEDPATGSGNSAFGHYLISQGQWPGNIVLEQGPSRDIPNIVKLRRSRVDQQDRILFGGASVLRIRGEYCLQS